MRERELTTLYVNFEHVMDFDAVRLWSAGGPGPGMAALGQRLRAVWERRGCGATPQRSRLERACTEGAGRPSFVFTCGLRQPASAHPPGAPPSSPSPRAVCPQALAANIQEAYYRLEPFLHAAVRNFVREHLDTYAEKDDGSDKQFWLSFYNLQVQRRAARLLGAAGAGG